MEKSNPSKQEVVGDLPTEEISKFKRFSLGEGAAVCQVCGSSLSGGVPVVVYVFRPAGSVRYQVGYVICGDAQHKHPEEFTLGVRELLVRGRVGWCSDAAMQESWPVLLDPEVVAVSEASTKTIRYVSSNGRGISSANVETGVDEPDLRNESVLPSSVKVSVAEARRRAEQDDDEVRGFYWGGQQ